MLRTLLVDDDKGMRCLLRQELEETGRFVVVGEACDGAVGIQQARRFPALDLILLDVNMPVMDGRTALPHLVAAAPTAMVVVLTMDGAQLAAPSTAHGATAVLSKSLDAPQLVRRLVDLAARTGRSRRRTAARAVAR